MKRLIVILVLIFGLAIPCHALTLRPYLATAPETQVFAKRVQDDGGTVIDLRYADKLVKLIRQMGIWSNVKFLADANYAYKSGVTTTVATLYDLSGNNNDATQATAGNQPVWTANVKNSKYGLVFDGNDILTANDSDSLDLTTAASAMGIGVATAVPISSRVFFVKNGDGGAAAGKYALSQQAGASPSKWQFTVNTGTWTDYLSNSEIADNVFTLMFGVFDGSNQYYFLNGSSDGSPANAGSIGTSIGSLQIGGYNASWGGSEYLIGKICNVGLFNINVSAAHRTALETFLNAYYGIY